MLEFLRECDESVSHKLQLKMMQLLRFIIQIFNILTIYYLFDIESKFDAVNNDFRTPVPRKFDVGFKEKLKREMIDIPKILSRSKDDIIDDDYIYNYEKGHKKYYELMMEYWGEA